MRYPLARALLAHFLERVGYDGPFHLTLSAGRFERARKKRGYPGPVDEHHNFGEALVGRPPVFFVNAPMHQTVRALADTCAHEVTHFFRQDHVHGKEFDAQIRRLLRGGRL